MIMFLKVLGLLGVFATVSNVAGITAPNSRPSRNEVALTSAVSADYPAQQKSSGSRLFRDIVAERELFIRFNFGERERYTLCGINREFVGGGNSVGLLLLEPSGILKTLIIDRDTLAVTHQKASLLRKELREELALNGVLVSDARLIAHQVVGLSEQAVTKK